MQLHFTHLYCFLTIELQVGFNNTDYTVREEDGSVSVCITVQEGNISDGVELHLGLSTQQVHGSAQGKYV